MWVKGKPLAVRVQPRASHSEVIGFRGDILRVRVAAPPEHGKANEALVELLAAALGIARGRIAILRGHASRDKLVAIEGMDLAAVQRILREES